MRRYSLILGIAGALLIGLYLLWPSLMQVAVQEALRTAQKGGARISWSGLRVSGFSVAVDTFNAWIPGPLINGAFRPPIKIELEQSQLRLSPWSLMKLTPAIEFNLRAYGGSVEGAATGSLATPRVSATLQGLDLSKHEQIRALGFTSAFLNGTISELERMDADAVRGSFNLTLNRIELPRLPPALLQLVTVIKLQPLKDGEVQLRGMIEPSSLHLEEVKIVSSYGSALGSCRARNLTQPGMESADGEFEVSIGESLHPQLSQWLPLLSNNALTSDTRRFTARMRGMPCGRSPRVLGDLALGSLCIRFTPTRTG